MKKKWIKLNVNFISQISSVKSVFNLHSIIKSTLIKIHPLKFKYNYFVK